MEYYKHKKKSQKNAQIAITKKRLQNSHKKYRGQEKTQGMCQKLQLVIL